MTKYKYFNSLLTTTLILCLISRISPVSLNRDTLEQPHKTTKTITETNRFYSVEFKQADYNISSMTQGKPLILTLLKSNKIANIIKEGLTITFTGTKEDIVCPFKKIADLCVVPQVPQNLKMVIKCSSLPCQVQWKIYQPTPQTAASNQPALNLYKLQNTRNHLIGQITCNDPKISTFDQDITVYSDTPFTRAYNNNVVYILFSSFQQGYIYVDVAQQTKNCAIINFTNVISQIKDNQAQINDFVTKQSKTIFQIVDTLKTDFSIQCSATRLDSFKNIKTSLQVSLIGKKNGKYQHLITKKIKSIARSNVDDFTFIFKAPDSDYTNLQIEFEVDNSQIVMLNLGLVKNDPFLVEPGETIHFNLQKGQKINLKINGQSHNQKQNTNYFIPERKQQVKLSITECKTNQDCNIEVEAIENTENLIYISRNNINSTSIDSQGKGFYEFQQIEFISVDKQIKHKIRLGDNIFLKKQVKSHKAYQIHVNSPNVLLYAASKSSCTVPDNRCKERTGNYHHPFVYQTDKDDELLINVEGLSNTQFQLTIMEDDKILPLTDGTAFSYSMDAQEQKISFSFKLKQKSDVSFNLISPLNALKLYVSNQANGGQDLQTFEQSSDGYLLYEKSQIKSLQFTITVAKSKPDQKYFTHFTIVASSSNSHLRLQPSVTNYQTLQPQKSRQFIFQLTKSDDFILSISLFNLKKKQTKLEILYSNDDKWTNSHTTTILKQVDFINLKDIGSILCEKEGEDQCEIFIKITNKMEVEIDLTVVLLEKNSIIELKDGIWQSFPANVMISTSSFYFYPHHNDKNILIFYHTSLENVHMSYKLWRYDKQTINPTNWPFPFIVDPSQKAHANFKKSSTIAIDHQELTKTCWPNCVVLLNFYIQQITNAPLSLYQYSFFKIMASNSQIQLPQNHKVSFTLGKQQDKQVLVDLKYPLTKSMITFYSTSTIGQCLISANVYSQKKQECPIDGELPDFTISRGEFRLKSELIKKKLQEKKMEEDKNLYLCIGIHSQSTCKITLEYTAQDNIFKQMHVDTYEDVKIDANQTKYYQLDGSIQQYSKITRLNGFPFVAVTKCEKIQTLQNCKAQFIKSQDLGKQIFVKTQSLSEQSCPTCTFLIKFHSIQPAQLSFHSQSKFSQIELKERITVSDFLNQNQQNKYQIHCNKQEDLIINIHVQEGNIDVKLTDGSSKNLIKSSTNQKKIVQFVIKRQSPEQKDNKKNEKHQQLDKQDVSTSLLNPLALSNDLLVYHLIISSSIKDKASSYTIAYASGKRQFFLQDGLIVDYQLQSNKLHSFFYCNQNSKDHIYYTLSTQSSETLKKMKISTFSYEDITDSSTKKSYSYQKPNLNKKVTPNPTLVMEFNNYSCYEIQITNQSPKSEQVSMGINHREVVFLPFNHQYPIILHKDQYLTLLADVNIPGFIDMTIKKCDQSVPILGYTFDYQGFKNDQFLYEAALSEQSSFKYHIKALRIGTLYIKLKANPQEQSVLNIKLNYSEQKLQLKALKAGNHGIINYQFIDSSTANLTFTPAQCSGCKNVKYFAISSQDQEYLFQQLVCSNNYFGVTKIANKVPINLPKTKDGQKVDWIHFTFKPQSGVAYVGILAVSESGEETYYKPIQISTLWSKFGQNSISQRVVLILFVLISLCIVIICIRRMARKGYKPLQEFPE